MPHSIQVVFSSKASSCDFLFFTIIIIIQQRVISDHCMLFGQLPRIAVGTDIIFVYEEVELTAHLGSQQHVFLFSDICIKFTLLRD